MTNTSKNTPTPAIYLFNATEQQQVVVMSDNQYQNTAIDLHASVEIIADMRACFSMIKKAIAIVENENHINNIEKIASMKLLLSDIKHISIDKLEQSDDVYLQLNDKLKYSNSVLDKTALQQVTTTQPVPKLEPFFSILCNGKPLLLNGSSNAYSESVTSAIILHLDTMSSDTYTSELIAHDEAKEPKHGKPTQFYNVLCNCEPIYTHETISLRDDSVPNRLDASYYTDKQTCIDIMQHLRAVTDGSYSIAVLEVRK